MTYALYVAERDGTCDDLLTCAICGLRSTNLNRHIERQHEMTPAEYKLSFPGAQTCKLSSKSIAKIVHTKGLKDSKSKQMQREQARRVQATLETGVEMLTCRICGHQSALSLITHITRKHKPMSMSEYRSAYPDAIVQRASPQQCLASSQAMKTRLEDPDIRAAFLEWRSFPSEIKHWMRKGFTNEEAIAKVAEFQHTQSLKGCNPRTHALRSAKNSGALNPMSLASIAKRENVSIYEASKLTPCYGRNGPLHPMFGKRHTEEALQKIAQRLNLHGGASNVEREMTSALLSMFHVGETNAVVCGWCCDFLVRDRKFIVEMFGDFWHHNPLKYSETWINPFSRRCSVDVWERDRRRIEDLRANGYTVVVVWELDWNKQRETVLRMIQESYNSTCAGDQ